MLLAPPSKRDVERSPSSSPAALEQAQPIRCGGKAERFGPAARAGAASWWAEVRSQKGVRAGEVWPRAASLSRHTSFIDTDGRQSTDDLRKNRRQDTHQPRLINREPCRSHTGGGRARNHPRAKYRDLSRLSRNCPPLHPSTQAGSGRATSGNLSKSETKSPTHAASYIDHACTLGSRSLAHKILPTISSVLVCVVACGCGGAFLQRACCLRKAKPRQHLATSLEAGSKVFGVLLDDLAGRGLALLSRARRAGCASGVR